MSSSHRPNRIHSVPHYPAEDSKLRASDLKIRRGGNCPNSLEVLQQLIGVCDAARLYLVSSLPRESSLATKRIISSFGDNTQVDFKHCLFRQEHVEAASSYIIRSGRTGSRTLVNYNDLPEITPNELDAIIQSFNADEETWWHFEVSLAVKPSPRRLKDDRSQRGHGRAAYPRRH